MTAPNRISCLTHFGTAILKLLSPKTKAALGKKITIAQQINSSNLSLGSGEARFARYKAGKGQPRAAQTANRPRPPRPAPRARAAPPGRTVGGRRSEGGAATPTAESRPRRLSSPDQGGVFPLKLSLCARPAGVVARRGRGAPWAFGGRLCLPRTWGLGLVAKRPKRTTASGRDKAALGAACNGMKRFPAL